MSDKAMLEGACWRRPRHSQGRSTADYDVAGDEAQLASMWLENEQGGTDHRGQHHGMVGLGQSIDQQHHVVVEGRAWANATMTWLGWNLSR